MQVSIGSTARRKHPIRVAAVRFPSYTDHGIYCCVVIDHNSAISEGFHKREDLRNLSEMITTLFAIIHGKPVLEIALVSHSFCLNRFSCLRHTKPYQVPLSLRVLIIALRGESFTAQSQLCLLAIGHAVRSECHWHIVIWQEDGYCTSMSMQQVAVVQCSNPSCTPTSTVASLSLAILKHPTSESETTTRLQSGSHRIEGACRSSPRTLVFAAVPC